MLATMPPGPRGRPVLGHASSLARDGLGFLRACANEYGDLVPLRFFWKRLLFVNHPDYVGQVLATHHGKVRKGMARHADHLLLGDGLSLREGDLWLRNRRVLQPAFQRDRLPTYGDVVVDWTRRLVETWRDGEKRDAYADMSALTRAIVADTLFGIDLESDGERLADTLAIALACRGTRLRSVAMLLPDGFPTAENIRIRHARRQIDALLDPLIARRRSTGTDSHHDLLSRLIHAKDDAGRELTGEEIRDEILTVFVGGNETVADLLTWIWYLLAQHPDVETRLLAEVDHALVGRPPTLSDVKRLPYVSMIVTETLRLFPPAAILERETIAGLDLGGTHVATGTSLIVSPWVLHRDARFFADPDVFNPDRWADGLAGRLPPYAYFPFGGGPRLCIGKSFATMEAILVVAAVAQRFRLALAPDWTVVTEPIPTLHPKHGLRMVLEQRAPIGVGS